MSQPADQPEQPDARPVASPPGGHRPGAALTALAVALVVFGLGAPLGLLWALLAPDVPLRVTDAGPIYRDPQAEHLFAADGWFTLLAIPFGVLAAVGAWLAARSIRGAPGLVATTLGAVAAGVLAWWLGRQIGLSDYQATLAAAEAGADLGRPPDLKVIATGWWPPRVLGVLLVPAFAAAATYTLLAAWSAQPSLRPQAPPAGDDAWPQPGQGGSPAGMPPRFRHLDDP